MRTAMNLMLASAVMVAAGLSCAGCKTTTTRTDLPPGHVEDTTTSSGPQIPTDTGQARPQPQLVTVQPLPGAAAAALVGKAVRISLRRDALGLASNSVPEPTATTITGRPVQLSGVVQSVADGWIVVRGQGDPNASRTYWVPMASILLIETDSPP